MLKLINKFSAFLFDFDGVLADTMNDNFFAWQKAFADYEADIKKEDYFPLEGLKLIDVARTIGSKFSVQEEDYAKIVAMKNEYYLKNNKFSLYSGAGELIDFLRDREFPRAIVSASPREKLKKTVPKEFLKKFNVVLSQEDYETGKPSPIPYLTAAEKLNVPINECIVVENSPLGIKSAKSAGAYCIAIASTLSREYLSEADQIIEKITDIKELDIIKKLFNETLYKK